MKGGCVAGLPVLCVVSPFCLRGGRVEWRGAVGCVLSPCSHCPRPPRIVLFPLSLRVVPCLLWVGKCGGCAVFIVCVGLYYGVCGIVTALCCVVVLCVEKRRVVCVMNSGVCCGDVCCFIAKRLSFSFPFFVFAVTAVLV